MYYPAFAFDSMGNVYLVWEKKTSTHEYDIYFSKNNGSSWTNPVKISNEPYAELASVGVSENGKIHVVYQSKEGNEAFIYYVSSADSGLSWSTATKIADGLRPRIAVSSNKVHVVWNSPSPYGIYYRFLQNGNWSSPLTVSLGHKDQRADIAIDSGGNPHIVWGKYDTTKVSYAKIEGNSVKDLKDNLGGSLGLSLIPTVDVDENNVVHVTFQGKNTDTSKWGIYYVKKDSSGWGDVQTISQSNSNQQVPSIFVRQSKGMIAYTDSSNIWLSLLK